ncbi:MAG: hypothetical protein ACI9QD_001140 [Thermoproteota archaeon]|jgi:hypothetical protein
MKFKLNKFCLRSIGQKGQASFEYILLIAVISFVAFALFAKIEAYMVTNPDSLVNKYLSSYTDMFGANTNGLNLRYKRFYIRR